jgi:hypothetical protein
MSSTPMEHVVGLWKPAFDSHQTDVMASLFMTEALFQDFGPTVISGRIAIQGYFDEVPDDRSADVSILYTYAIGDDVAGGFADVTFSDPQGWAAPVHLSLVLQRCNESWLIRQYHVSLVMSEH